MTTTNKKKIFINISSDSSSDSSSGLNSCSKVPVAGEINYKPKKIFDATDEQNNKKELRWNENLTTAEDLAVKLKCKRVKLPSRKQDLKVLSKVKGNSLGENNNSSKKTIKRVRIKQTKCFRGDLHVSHSYPTIRDVETIENETPTSGQLGEKAKQNKFCLKPGKKHEFNWAVIGELCNRSNRVIKKRISITKKPKKILRCNNGTRLTRTKKDKDL